MLVEIASSTRIQVMSATLDPIIKVVVESGTTPIDGTYPTGDLVPFICPAPGDEVIAYGTSSALATVAVTNLVFSDGNGFVHLGTAIAGTPGIGTVLEAATISANGLTQFKIEVL